MRVDPVDNYLRQINYVFRNNDGGIQAPGSGGASFAAEINEDVSWEAAGEGYTGGIFRIRFTVRKTGEGDEVLRMVVEKNDEGWSAVRVSGWPTSRFALDSGNSFYNTMDDCPYIIAPLGGASDVYVEDNNCAVIEPGWQTGTCSFKGNNNGGGHDEETEYEASLIAIAEDVAHGDTLRYNLRSAATGVFSEGYTQEPIVIVRKQRIGQDWTQAAFRVRASQGVESLPPGLGGAAWLGGLNENITMEVTRDGGIGDPRGFRPRWLIQGNLPWTDEIQFVQVFRKNGGAWAEVTATTSGIQTIASDFLTQGDDTTDFPDRLGTGVWNDGSAGQIEDSRGAFFDWETGGLTETELEFSNVLVADDMEVGDIIELQVWRVVPPTAVFMNSQSSYPLETISATLTITVVAADCDWFDSEAGDEWQAGQADHDWQAGQADHDWLDDEAAPDWASPATADWFDKKDCT